MKPLASNGYCSSLDVNKSTTVTCGDETILKTDMLGRVKTPKERREQLLEEFEKSGLTGFEAFSADPQWTNYPSRFYRLRSP